MKVSHPVRVAVLHQPYQYSLLFIMEAFGTHYAIIA